MTDVSECNCGNCTNADPTMFDEVRCKVTDVVMGERRQWVIKHTGCLSHPRAWGVLMADVLDKLEMCIADAKKERNHERVEGYRKAANLIRGGGKG